MAEVAVSPASLLDLIAEIAEIPVNTRVLKEDCTDLSRRVCLLTHLIEEIRDSPPPESYASSSLTSTECNWWSDLVAGLHAARRILSIATSFQARDYSVGDARRFAFQFQCVTWKLGIALENMSYDRYDISPEVREQVELARSQFRRAMRRYGSLNSEMILNAISEPMEIFPAIVHPKIPLSNVKKSESPHRKSSSVSLAFFLSKDADEERLEEVVTKSNDDDSKKSEQFTIPEDFLCPISLELMKDPVIVCTGQTYESSYIQRWIDSGNMRCPKTQQELENYTLTPNYVLRSLISQWCIKHNIEKPSGSMNSMTNLTGDMSVIRTLVSKLTTESIEDQRTVLSKIRSLTIRSTENRILIAEAGAIPAIVNLLTSKDTETQENAVACVLNISLYESNKELVMFSGAVTYLVHVLKVGTMEAKENAAATIYSLSVAADENKILIGASGAIPVLVLLLENGSIRGKKDACLALFNLCIYQGNKGRVVRAGIVSPLLKMLTDSSQGMVYQALAVLSLIANNQDAKATILKANVIPPLVDILKKDQPINRENAAVILLSICKRDTEKLITIGRLGAVIPLMELSRDGTERAKRKAISLLDLIRKTTQ